MAEIISTKNIKMLRCVNGMILIGELEDDPSKMDSYVVSYPFEILMVPRDPSKPELGIGLQLATNLLATDETKLVYHKNNILCDPYNPDKQMARLYEQSVERYRILKSNIVMTSKMPTGGIRTN